MRNIETCRIRDIERPFIGEWSLKDIVGHVASWEAEAVSAAPGSTARVDARRYSTSRAPNSTTGTGPRGAQA